MISRIGARQGTLGTDSVDNRVNLLLHILTTGLITGDGDQPCSQVSGVGLMRGCGLAGRGR